MTGAFGNLGRSVVQELHARGQRVRAFDLPTRANRAFARKWPGLKVVWGDLTCAEDVERAVQDVRGIAHLAGILPPLAERKPALTRAVNVEGTRLLVEHALRVQADLPLVFASSCSVYGPGAGARGMASGTSPTEASDVYTATKLEAEALVTASTLSWVILRIGAAVEASAAATDLVVLRMMFEVRADNPIELVHSADVARAVASAVETPAVYRKVLPIGGGKSCQLTQRQLLAASFGVLGVRDLPASAHGRADYYTCWLDTEESERLLRFQQHDFADIERDLAKRFVLLRPFRPLLGPLVRLGVLRFSGPYRKQPTRSSLRAFIDEGY